MDFSFSEEQETVSKVARPLFEARATPEHLGELERRNTRYDPALWAELATSDLLGIALPQAVGGSGGSFLELGVLLAEVGWSVAPVPVYPTLLLGADTLARHGSPTLQQAYLPDVLTGRRQMTAAVAESGASEPTSPATSAWRDNTGWVLDGAKTLVPGAQLADTIIVSARTDEGPTLFLLDKDTDGVTITPAAATNGEPVADIALTGARVPDTHRLDAGEDPVGSLFCRALVGLCAIQLGVAERALQFAATYTSEREQFGRPIGSFQAVQQRMADAFIDVEAIRWTTWYAAWRVAKAKPAWRDAAIAKFWAAEAGARVTATAQQVHGGLGIDVTYPLSRYFLWAKQIELTLGSASQQLARLGSTYPEGIQ